jgi:hypothetical protein
VEYGAFSRARGSVSLRMNPGHDNFSSPWRRTVIGRPLHALVGTLYGVTTTVCSKGIDAWQSESGPIHTVHPVARGGTTRRQRFYFDWPGEPEVEYRRIQGELMKRDIRSAAGTIASILRHY